MKVWVCGKNGVPCGQKGVDGGRPRFGRIVGVKVALGSRLVTVEAVRQCAKDRKEWRALVHK